jgi:eukaryotic-like serine/threonine-protein kinase
MEPGTRWSPNERGIILKTMSLAPGTRLAGYEVLGPLGSGGMGEVYRARDSVLRREVAIKVLPPLMSQDPERLRRFEQEAQAAAALNHPNILAVHQFGIHEGAPYLVSELLEGDTLRQLLQRGPLPARKAIDFGVHIAHGLAAAHEKGIVHRDLKPENLFVTRDGRVKILDFGLAKLKQKPDSDGSGPTQTFGTEPGMVLGTVGYMSPEQVRGKPADHRADIFAFGAILYEMLAGKRAFEKATSVETMTAILNEEPPTVSQISQSTPLGLQRVVRRCLEKNAEQRFQSASDLAFAIEAISESGISGAIAAPTPAQRKSDKLRSWSIGMVAVLVFAAASYFVILHRGQTQSLRVSDYTQITRDGHAGAVVATDGARLYISRGIGLPAQVVAVTGGTLQPMSFPWPKPFLVDVSPDGSTALVLSYEKGLLPTQPLYTVQLLGGEHRYLADAAGAGWGPSDESIVYFTAANDSYLIRSDGTAAHKFASLAGPPDSFSWRPGGKSIRYSTNGRLWEMSSEGTRPHELLQGWRTPHEKSSGAWSPDGSVYVFLSGPGPQIWAMDERLSLFHTSSSQPYQLTSGPISWGGPVFSKDGTKMFTSGSTPGGQLVRFDARSNRLEPFLSGISAEFVAFSKDGDSVAYVSYPDGILWKAKPDGSDRVQLSAPPMQPRLVSVSPDGTQILFTDSSATGVPEAYIVSSQQGSPRRLLPDETTPETDANWSPDGREIAFSTSKETGRNRNSTINIFDVATQRVTTLPGSVGMFSPRWSPDGKSIAADTFDASRIRVFNLKTQQWSTLHEGLLGWFQWSKDSQSMFLLKYTEAPGVYRISVAGGKEERVVDLKDVPTTGYYGLWLGLDPSDAPLLLRDTGTTDIYALTLERK